MTTVRHVTLKLQVHHTLVGHSFTVRDRHMSAVSLGPVSTLGKAHVF
jgi:hypothetical protein